MLEPANITMTQEMYSLIRVYIKKLRPKFEKDNNQQLFITTRGSKCSHVSSPNFMYKFLKMVKIYTFKEF